jgi:glycosyltransferase involved in cell wall biosynthesis
MMVREVSEWFKQMKVCVLVPTYNNEQTLGNVLNGILKFTNQIVVVNDGSTDSTTKILEEYPHLSIVRYLPNKGKGYALRQGFKRALELGYDYAISIDSDGQHYAEDLPEFLDKLNAHPQALIIGARNMDQESVPGKSNFGRKFSNFWFWFETGLQMNDTQSGYRLYPLKLLSQINFVTRKFEFEVEVLVRAAWQGIEVLEMPVRVFYPEKEKRVSHFRPVKDFTRISILNTVLVTITLLYIKPRDFIRSFKKKTFWQALRNSLFNPEETDHIKALSIGFGIFMGIVPIWGFQLAVAIALAFLLRLNKALVIIAANISIPPMIPLILFLSHTTGGYWMGDKAQYILFDKSITLEMLQHSVYQYVIGAITLATIAGFIFGGAAFLVLKATRSKSGQ